MKVSFAIGSPKKPSFTEKEKKINNHWFIHLQNWRPHLL
jgi:hypothetical protein